MTNSHLETNREIRKLNLLSRAQDFELKKREAFFANLIDILNQESPSNEIVNDLKWFIRSKENPFPQAGGATQEELDEIFNETFEDFISEETVDRFLDEDDIMPWEQSETMTEVSLPLEFPYRDYPTDLPLTERP